jgi:hypothetical protein
MHRVDVELFAAVGNHCKKLRVFHCQGTLCDDGVRAVLEGSRKTQPTWP